MDDQIYQDVLQYKLKDTLPQKFTSSKSNFIALCQKYKVNRKGCLTRNGKAVVKKSMQVKNIFFYKNFPTENVNMIFLY